MNYLDCEQGSAAWFDARLGCVTSTRVDDAISVLTRKSGDKNPGDETAARERLRVAMMCELLTGKAAEHYVSKWMDEGKDKEPQARAAYEIAKSVDCEIIGFAFHPTITLAGASPDALIGNDGLAEFKCPKTETHLKYLLAGVVPKEYKPQMYWQMACCEREWCDFASHDPSLKNPRLRTFIAPRMYRDDKIISDMETKVAQFNEHVQEMIIRLDPDYIANKLAASIEQANAKKEQGLEDAINADSYITEEDIRA